MKPKDAIDAPPTLAGPGGRAWLVPPNGVYALASIVCCWIVEAQWAHSVWHSYCLSLVHLRQSAALPSPLIYLRGATHELVLFALDPEHPRALMLAGGEPHVLQPCNFAAQFVASCDAAAFERVEKAADAIVQGNLSPDTDHIREWINLFGSNMIKR
jgi:hypothetical protein